MESYIVVRVDFYLIGENVGEFIRKYAADLITLKSQHFSYEEAEIEAERLNKLSSNSGVVYVVRPLRA
jgi:hypothetical protein